MLLLLLPGIAPGSPVIGDRKEKVVAKLWNMLSCLLSSCGDSDTSAADGMRLNQTICRLDQTQGMA
jgi:hypothetical protein